MKIKKGDWFKCLKGSFHFTKDKYYKAIGDDALCDDSGDFHGIGYGYAIGRFEKLYTIQDLKDGKVAVENDGAVEDIINVVKHCLNAKVNGNAKYYFENDGWDAGNRTGLPIQSVKDFLVQLPKKEEAWEPKVGEMVEFKNFASSTEWCKSEYLATDKESSEPYALVYTAPTGSRFIITSPEIRQIPKKIKVTKQEIADKMGIELNQIEII